MCLSCTGLWAPVVLGSLLPCNTEQLVVILNFVYGCFRTRMPRRGVTPYNGPYGVFIYLFIYLCILLLIFFLTACSINYDWNVFLSGEEHNFLKYNNSLIDSLGTRYDYLSVMHYSQDAFSRNGLPTILVKREGVCGRYIIRIVTYH